ncbi:polyprenyl synthetase family protein [Streptomyces fildesensis]|uniref:Polyprenyl synthetase family protein n=1 Tax=Streptomyces fildesensis TaxID=375757 RepID=A0ABW8BYN6_9ACTN
MTTHPLPPKTSVPGQLRAGLLDQVEERLRGLLAGEFDRWHAVNPRAASLVGSITELVRAGGDRIRPVICVTGYLAAGGDPTSTAIVDAAAALELLDTCFLIRSDIRDNAPLRHGIPTLHVSHAAEHERSGWRGESRRFGEGTAVLAGDLALAYADRLASRLPAAAWQLWDELRTERVIGAHTDAACATEYLDDPWPGRCIAGCAKGCGAGWYALHHPLLLGAALAGRQDLATSYRDYARPLHAAWRLRGFLEGGPGYDWDAQMLREVLLGTEERDTAERIISQLVARADRVVDAAPLAPGWRDELAAFAIRISGLSE